MLHFVFAVGCCMASAHGAATIELRNPTVAASGIVAEQEGRTLIATTGEPVAGVVHAGTHRLSTGFPATLALSGMRGDHLFADGFEQAGESNP